MFRAHFHHYKACINILCLLGDAKLFLAATQALSQATKSCRPLCTCCLGIRINTAVTGAKTCRWWCSAYTEIHYSSSWTRMLAGIAIRATVALSAVSSSFGVAARSLWGLFRPLPASPTPSQIHSGPWQMSERQSAHMCLLCSCLMHSHSTAEVLSHFCYVLDLTMWSPVE